MSRILLADDDDDILMVLRLTFESAGHEVVATQEPEKVLHLVTESSPDAVILDVMMPGKTGWDLLAELREQPETRALPVVLLTALSDVNHRVKGLRGGADDYQSKPFEPDELLARVEGLIARRTPAPASAPAPRHELTEAVEELELRVVASQGLEGLRLGRYEVKNVLGRGAMGTVLAGWDPKLRRHVALKTIRFRVEGVEHSERRKLVSRLLHEAVANARFNHPNIVTVYDLGEEENAAFIAMELIEGKSLESHLETHRKLPLALALSLGVAVARALAAAHNNGIVHRDVKPANILLGHDRSIKVTDFGISEILSQSGPKTLVFGTPGYLAPETLGGDPATPRSDLFALGVLLYETLIGRHPFLDRYWRQTLRNTIHVKPPALDEVCPEATPAFAALVSDLMEKDAGKRPPQATDVAAQLTSMATEGRYSWSLDVPPDPEGHLPSSPTRSRLMSLTSMPLAMAAAPV